MYDGTKIVGGLAIFVALAGFPIWYSFAATPADRDGDGQADYQAVPQLPDVQGGCIEDTAYMRSAHMQLLDRWRNDAVRYQHRTYEAVKDKRVWDKSLSRTCMSCHTNQQEFCGECHDFLGVTPTCWDCHVEPELDQVSPPAQPSPPPPPPPGGSLGARPTPATQGRK